jgi:four helix bundle protein
MSTVSPEVMKDRTRALAVRLVALCENFPRSTSGRVFADQLIRSATSVGSNYRASRRARSRKEFIAKLGVVIEEADECLYWLEMAVECNLIQREVARSAWKEMNEILSIIVATVKTTRKTKSPVSLPTSDI